MNTTPEAVGYIVLAELVLGQPAEPIHGKWLHDSIDCAAHEVRDMTVALGLQGRGATFLARHEGMPVGVAVTASGDMWAVEIRPLPTVLIAG